jgi:predicted kinase
MVVEKLVGLQEWRDLSPFDQSVVFMGALFHDMAKPNVTKIEDGVISSRGHAGLGARKFRELAWNSNMKGHMDMPWIVREYVADLIMLHALPFYFYDKENPEYHVFSSSVVVKNKLLALLCEADMKGRICKDQEDQEYGLDVLDTFREYCKELDCYEKSKVFPSGRARIRYYFDKKGSPLFDYYDKPKGTAIIMCGVPGCGKNYTIREKYDLPVVGIDETRNSLKLKYGKNEGLVLQTAYENAKKHLRKGETFIYNATNTAKDIRGKWITMFRKYGYQVDCCYVEKSMKTALKNNKDRDITIPEKFIVDKFFRLDFPTELEFQNMYMNISKDNE